MSAAELFVKYFQANVVFVPRSNRKTPDFIIGGVEWELKAQPAAGGITLGTSYREGTAVAMHCF